MAGARARQHRGPTADPARRRADRRAAASGRLSGARDRMRSRVP